MDEPGSAFRGRVPSDEPWVTPRSQKVSELIARRIVREIVRERLQPGAMLPSEAEMLKRFQIGRGSLREALRILEAYGLITIRPGPRGGPVLQTVTSHNFARASSFYFHLDGSTFGDLLQARKSLEPLMARLAAETIQPESIELLQQNLTSARNAIEADAEEWTYYVYDFHNLVAGSSHNKILDLFARALRDLYLDRLDGRSAGAAMDRLLVCDEHEAVAAAIIAGDASKAERLMTDHMNHFVDRMTRELALLMDDVLGWK